MRNFVAVIAIGLVLLAVGITGKNVRDMHKEKNKVTTELVLLQSEHTSLIHDFIQTAKTLSQTRNEQAVLVDSLAKLEKQYLEADAWAAMAAQYVWETAEASRVLDKTLRDAQLFPARAQLDDILANYAMVHMALSMQSKALGYVERY